MRTQTSHKKPAVKLQSPCFEKLIFEHVFNVKKKAKKIAKFDGFEPRHCEDTKASVAAEISPKGFATFEKQASGQNCSKHGWG